MNELLAHVAPAVVQSLDDALFILSEEGVIRDLNPSAERMFGLARNELVGKQVDAFLLGCIGCRPEGGRGALPSACGRGGQVIARHRDGSEFPVAVALSRLPVEGRLLICARIRNWGNSEDMAQDFHPLELELKGFQSEMLYERSKLWKLASNPFVVIGEARVTDSGIALTYLGDIDPGQKLGLAPGTIPETIEALSSMMHPEESGVFRQTLERSLVTGEPFEHTYHLADGNGGWRWIESRGISLDVRDGQNFEWLFISRDFTQQKEVEASLRHSVETLRASRSELKNEKEKLWKIAANAFSLLGEAYLTEDGIELVYFGDGVPDEKVGLKKGTLPKSVDMLLKGIHPNDKMTYINALEHSIATGDPLKVLYRWSDGEIDWRWMQLRAFSLKERNGKHIRWLHDTIDLTDQKRTEEALRKSLDELHRLKTRLQSDNDQLRQMIETGGDPVEIVGQGDAIVRVLHQIEMVAAVSSTVLVSGETGTGKELVARAIHQRSARRNRLFVAVNCAALPPTLAESELFGHEKGAFTGAFQRRLGRFEQADGGTLFLDEVGELPLETQAKMLRVLQAGVFERVGGGRSIKTDVRVIAASNRDLERAVREGLFRNDLYHRLSVFPIHLPPLRERREDIPLLAAHLITQKARQLKREIDMIPKAIVERLVAYDWPGNVRELANVLERAIILSPGTALEIDSIHLGPDSPAIKAGSPIRPGAAVPYDQGDTLQATERAHILRVCQASDWRIKGPDGAAIKLGLNPGTLYARMKKLGIRRPQAE